MAFHWIWKWWSAPVLAVLIVVPSFARAVTLEEAFAAAERSSELLAQQGEKVTQASEHVSQAHGSLLPTIAFNASHLTQPEPADPFAQRYLPPNQTTLSLSAAQPIFRGFREHAGLRQQINLLRSQENVREGVRLKIYQDVATSYLNILTLEQDIQNLDAQLKIYAEQVSELRGRVNRGESSATEVLTAESSSASVEAEQELVKGQLKIARENFASLTGLAADSQLSDPDILGSEKKIVIADVEKFLERIPERPDVRAAEERLKASGEQVRIAKGGHWPSIDLLGNYYFQRPEGMAKDIKWDVQVRLVVPLFEGGVTQSKVREAHSLKTEAELELHRLKRAAGEEIRSLHEGLRMRAKQIEVLRRTVDLAERNYQVLRRDYRRGLTRNVDVQLALASFRTARRVLDQAHFTAQLELIRIEIASASTPQAKPNGGVK